MPQNPIYQREKGGWGNPNPFYDKLTRYSPFVIMAAIILGVCATLLNPALFADEELLPFYLLLCLPGLLLSTITLYGSLMAPALTAPLISMERDRGTWDLLRVTPQSTRSILLAKMLGALARLRIWRILLGVSLLQGTVILCGLFLAGSALAGWSWLLGLATLTRPWVEILFAGFAGLFLSTMTRSAVVALVGGYTAVFLFKLFNNSLFWLAASTLSGFDNAASLFSSIGPTAVYTLAILLMWLGIILRAEKIAD